MRRPHGIAHQHDFAVIQPLVANDGKLTPHRAVGYQRMTVEFIGEQLFAVLLRFRFRYRIHSRGQPGLVRTLDDPGRHALLVTIAVHPPPAVLILLEDEIEIVERFRRRQPAEVIAAPVLAGAELFLEALANHRRDAVTGNDQVVTVDVEFVDGADVASEFERDSELVTAIVQDVQQLQSRHAAEPVPLRVDRPAMDRRVDAAPVRELFDNALVRRRVGLHETAQRIVGEHDAEAPGRIPIATLDDGDVGTRVGFFHQDRKVQRGRPAAEAHDLHAVHPLVIVTPALQHQQTRGSHRHRRTATGR